MMFWNTRRYSTIGMEPGEPAAHNWLLPSRDTTGVIYCQHLIVMANGGPEPWTGHIAMKSGQRVTLVNLQVQYSAE